ncbi:DUF6588 family protein [Saccharicrinis fermentans]|uniref:Outer membrane protein beta-barrel domain-containing protein n=1 Tax=Saccharicrinis fermentans DSM 9555 = JCM 21142 TaxID=869213 RepID=W7Y4U0_9BACT|nr:DUF6588 family protein [Saccharicrinis fermentans]GAF03107.1 hypothetical protein JCM21142_41766 [Saccharicrinis fermentans DSM 9555 = JCM 21142]
MKKIYLLIMIALVSFNAMAQEDVVDFLKAGAHDANVLAKPYLKPFGEMLGKGMNNGWYNSAKPHKLFGFDLTVTASLIQAPSSAATFDIAKYEDNLQEFELKNPNNSISPTVSGDMENLPVLTDKATGLSEITMPNGTGMDFLPIPMVTAGVGLPMGFELKGRFIPEIDIEDAGKVGLWGLGVQKDIKDYIPGVKHIPILNVSALVAYTHFSSEIDIEDGGPDGKLEISAGGLSTRLIVGANLPVVAFYAGMGYGKSNSDFNLLGTYNVGDDIPVVLKDPIKLGYSTSSFDANVGMRIRLGVIALHADYTLGEYSAITAGFGLSFR